MNSTTAQLTGSSWRSRSLILEPFTTILEPFIADQLWPGMMVPVRNVAPLYSRSAIRGGRWGEPFANGLILGRASCRRRSLRSVRRREEVAHMACARGYAGP